MKKAATIYHIILDRSGSMADCKQNTINGFNEQLRRIAGLEQEFPTQQISIGLTMFDNEVTPVYLQRTPREVAPLNSHTYTLGGSTALYDAIGLTIRDLQQHPLSLDPSTTYVVIVLTDGYENSSRLFSLGQVRSTIAELEATGRWTFSFIGATLDAVEVGESLNIKRQNSFGFDKSAMKKEVWDKLGDSMHHYMNNKLVGADLSNLYDHEDKLSKK